uniref:Uncharacterized protein n=1 Tax=Ciona savignyi TaxID=51511 RepID=H2YC43_CIOSA
MKEYNFTDQDKHKFEENGVIALEDFLSVEECDKLRDECWRIVDEMDPMDHKTIFSTNNHEQMESDYLLGSSNKIRFFWEKEALDDSGMLRFPKHNALNKIGHALHLLSKPFKDATFSSNIKNILRNLDFIKPVIPQSMFIFKVTN